MSSHDLPSIQFQILSNKKGDYYRLKSTAVKAKKESDDDGGLQTAQQNVFIQRLLKISLDDKIFDDNEMYDELRTMLISVISLSMSFESRRAILL